MSLTRWTYSTFWLFLVFSGASAEDSRLPDPLFQSTEILDVRVVAPMSTLLSDRPFEEELPGSFHFMTADGQAVELDMQLRTRGKFRRKRDVCKFPPIRLNFKASQTKGTLFHKQDKVKLVTHCQRTSKYEQVLLREYLAYRLLNVITDTSFRVRLMRITYVDSEEKKRDDVQFGFIIEHRDRLAKRLQIPVLEVPAAKPSLLDPEYSNLIAVYHYLIGNTDFSSVRGPKDDMCCHNHVLFGNEDELILSIPYDFDQSGLVDAEHAGANPKFKLRSVRQRLYRGRCIHNDHLDSTLATYNNKRDEILAVLTELDVTDKGSRKSMVSFVEKFYKILGSERRVKGEFVKKCI